MVHGCATGKPMHALGRINAASTTVEALVPNRDQQLLERQEASRVFTKKVRRMEILWLMELLARQLDDPNASDEAKRYAIAALEALCEDIRRIRQTWGVR